MKKLSLPLSLVTLLVLGSSLFSLQVFAAGGGGGGFTDTYVWSETLAPIAGNGTGGFQLASNADGSHLILAVNSERVYLSDDSGASWNETQPTGVDESKNWAAVASDADGSNLIVGELSGRMYVSNNSGSTWTETRPTGLDEDGSWFFAASDADGTHLMATDGLRVYISNNSGVSWTETQPAGDVDANWVSLVSDASGTNLLTAVSEGRMYISHNSGSTWNETQPVGDIDAAWASVASDADGSNLMAATGNSGRVYVSNDSGVSWTETQPADDIDVTWRSVASDADGSTLFAVGNTQSIAGTRAYVSQDGGDSWVETRPLGDVSANWYLATINSDGSNLFAIRSRGGFTTFYDLYRGTLIEANVVIDDSFASGDGFDDSVATLVIDGDNKILVGGYFTTYDSSSAPYIARLNIDGSFDSTLVTGDGFDGVVQAFAIQNDGKILVGGAFTTYDSDPVAGTARLNTDGSLDETFVTGDGFDSIVQALAIQNDGKIIVGGIFTTYDSDPAVKIARLNTDGSLDETFVTGDGFDAGVNAVTIDADGKILVGGAFTTYDSNPASHIARLNTDGSLDETFVTGDGFDNSVYTIKAQDDDKLLIGGGFTTYDSDSAVGIARLNTDGTLDETFITGAGFPDASVLAFSIDSDEKILVGGNFVTYDGNPAVSIARLNTDGTLDETFITGSAFNGSVPTLIVDSDGKILTGGNFSTYNGDPAVKIARLIASIEEYATIVVTKVVANDNGGTSAVEDFELELDGDSITSGVSVETLIGDYTVTESGPDGYTGTFSRDCDTEGDVTLESKGVYVCTLTNDDSAVVEDNNDGGSSSRHLIGETFLGEQRGEQLGDTAKKAIMEKIIVLLQELIQLLLARR